MIFERTIEFTPESVYFLKRTIQKDKINPETLQSLIEAVENESAVKFLIKDNDELYGVLILTITEDRRFLNVVTLGGKKFHKWRNELRDFVKDIARKTNTEILIISRKGWERIFPELKVIGSVYTL